MSDDIRLDLLRDAITDSGLDGQAVGRRGSRVCLLKRQLRGVEGDTEYLDAAREYSRAAGVAAWRRDALKKRRGR